MLIFLRILIDLGGFSFGYILCVYAAGSFARLVDGQHYLSGFLTIHAEKYLQHLNHKLHRRVVVIEQRHLPKRRLRQLRLFWRNNDAYLPVILRVLTTGYHPIFVHSIHRSRSSFFARFFLPLYGGADSFLKTLSGTLLYLPVGFLPGTRITA